MNEWEWRLLDDRPASQAVPHPGGELKPGVRVRLCPRQGPGDPIDLLIAGRTAIVESIEQDYEGRFHVAVVLDDDPGRDLGLMRQPGHRFFYPPEELEICPHEEAASQTPEPPLAPHGVPESILIAGIGNIFLGDDGFGVAVAQRLAARELPGGVRVVDYGIRSFDLAYALMEAPALTILVDACRRGEAPGTLFVIEPETADSGAEAGTPTMFEAHSMTPVTVIRMAMAMGARLNRILVLGCEPATLGPPEGQLGLSDEVSGAVDRAADLALSIVERVRRGEWPGATGRDTA
jgi:hydrogenase maturation protease